MQKPDQNIQALSLEELARLLGAPSLDKLETTSEKFSDTLETAKLFAAKKLNMAPVLARRANSKAVTEKLSWALCNRPQSPLFKAYQNTAACTSYIVEEDGRYKSKYCHNRWCLVCNRIKTAKYINEYTPIIDSFSNKRFLTLTTPNVPANQLKNTIELMNKQWYQIRDQHRKAGQKLKGVRKLEVTYNPERNDYHPHYHIVIEGNEPEGEEIIRQWIEKDNDRSPKAQKNDPCTDGSLKELFKYFTKITSDNKDQESITIPALDHIFVTLRGKRVFQSFGITKKQPLPDLEEITQAVNEKMQVAKEFKKWQDELPVMESYAYLWSSKYSNWIDYKATGSALTDYRQTENVRTFDKRFVHEITGKTKRTRSNPGRDPNTDSRQLEFCEPVHRPPK